MARLDPLNWVLVLALALSTYLARIGMFAGIKRIGGGEVGRLPHSKPFSTVLVV